MDGANPEQKAMNESLLSPEEKLETRKPQQEMNPLSLLFSDPEVEQVSGL
jgi:hypothetical protein